jgi:hypothetical protein
MPTAEALLPSPQHEAENRGKLFSRSRRIQTRIKKNKILQFHAAKGPDALVGSDPSFTCRQLADTDANRIGEGLSRFIRKLHGP